MTAIVGKTKKDYIDDLIKHATVPIAIKNLHEEMQNDDDDVISYNMHDFKWFKEPSSVKLDKVLNNEHGTATKFKHDMLTIAKSAAICASKGVVSPLQYTKLPSYIKQDENLYERLYSMIYKKYYIKIQKVKKTSFADGTRVIKAPR